MQNKYKEKVEKYKKKILDCKNKIADREKEIHEITRRSDEERIVQEKNLEILQLKLQEQRESYENRILLTEEDNHNKMVANLFTLSHNNIERITIKV